MLAKEQSKREIYIKLMMDEVLHVEYRGDYLALQRIHDIININ